MEQDEQGFLGDLNNDIYLTWNSSDRDKCKGYSGANSATWKIKCSDDDHSDENNNAWMMMMSVPIMLMVFAAVKMI